MPNDVTNTNAAILTLDSDAVLETAQSKARHPECLPHQKNPNRHTWWYRKNGSRQSDCCYLLQRISGCHSNHRNDDQPPSR